MMRTSEFKDRCGLYVILYKYVMDMRLLRYFVAVATERNFNRAADLLNMAQPPLSRAIRQLEHEVGGQLFERGTRPLSLTPAGALLFDQARQVLARMDSLRAMTRAAASTERRRFVIGFVASTIYARLPELIREFRRVAPDVELVLQEASTLDQISAIKDGRIDVGFGRIRFDDPAVTRIVLRDEKLVVAIPASHPLAASEGILSLADIGREPQIIYPRTPRPSYADQVLSIFRDNAIEPYVIHEASELQIAIGLVAAEEGLAIVPESVRRARNHDVVYRDIVENLSSPIIMSFRANDRSPCFQLMSTAIALKYSEWGYTVPAALPMTGAA